MVGVALAGRERMQKAEEAMDPERKELAQKEPEF
jgi:hypothetical protein